MAILSYNTANADDLKWAIIHAISEASDRHGNLLLALMDEAGAMCTNDVTLEQAQEYCKRHGVCVKKEGTADARLPM